MDSTVPQLCQKLEDLLRSHEIESQKIYDNLGSLTDEVQEAAQEMLLKVVELAKDLIGAGQVQHRVLIEKSLRQVLTHCEAWELPIFVDLVADLLKQFQG